jgi:flagellar motor switch protein FliG
MLQWLHCLDLVLGIVVKMVPRRRVFLSKHLKKSRTEQLVILLDSAHNKQTQPFVATMSTRYSHIVGRNLPVLHQMFVPAAAHSKQC